MAEGKHLVLWGDLSFVSSQHKNVSYQVEMGSFQPPLGHVMWNGWVHYFKILLCMNALSSTLKWCDLVAIGLHVVNMYINREASPIEVAETAHVISRRKGITRPGSPPHVELQMLVLFLKIMAKNDIITQIFQ